jgi:ABC-type dipeptide/oligopeptide/nickel transport system ATPase component
MLLDVKNLKVQFNTDFGTVKAVDGVDLSLKKGEILGIVGESGSGKSMISFSIMNMLPKNGKIAAGSISYRTKENEKVDIAKLKPSSKKMRGLRGHEISMIFQEPMSSLNPVYTIGYQLKESLMQEKLQIYKKHQESTMRLQPAYV